MVVAALRLFGSRSIGLRLAARQACGIHSSSIVRQSDAAVSSGAWDTMTWFTPVPNRPGKLEFFYIIFLCIYIFLLSTCYQCIIPCIDEMHSSFHCFFSVEYATNYVCVRL